MYIRIRIESSLYTMCMRVGSLYSFLCGHIWLCLSKSCHD